MKVSLISLKPTVGKGKKLNSQSQVKANTQPTTTTTTTSSHASGSFRRPDRYVDAAQNYFDPPEQSYEDGK